MIIHSGECASTHCHVIFCVLFWACTLFKQVSEILFVKHVENHLNVRITLKSTGERIREKRRSSKLCAKTKSLYRINISMQFPNDQVSSLFWFHFFSHLLQMWNLWLSVSAARLTELAHEETHSRGTLQLHLWVLSQEIWEAGQC